MSKRKYLQYNNCSSIRHNAVIQELNDLPYEYNGKQLYHCKAYVYDTMNYIVLYSYNTIVAYIDKHTGILYDVLRAVYGYTATSCQHISKFRNKYRQHITDTKIYE